MAGPATSTASKRRSPRTKMIFVNSPSNPTGWTADSKRCSAILDLARRKACGSSPTKSTRSSISAEARASFMDIMEPEDRILFVNTFSKNWAMTGWRIGWIKAHPSLRQDVREPGPVFDLGRRAVHAARRDRRARPGRRISSRAGRAGRGARDLVCRILGDTGRVRFSVPPGAFYLFFSVDGVSDARRAAFDIVDQANVGLAPGTAFGTGGEASCGSASIAASTRSRRRPTASRNGSKAHSPPARAPHRRGHW